MNKYKMMNDAYKMASNYHANQFYGSHSYMYHLEMVANSVGDNPEHIVVAWLHDIWEDTDCSVEEVMALFSYKIVQAISDLTKMKGEKYSEYITKVKSNPIALHVKIHDTLCNLTESVKTQQWGRVRKYSKQLELLCGGNDE
jgi:(p)ppGpp synthase/HD superfamily hydrolase